MSVEVVIPALGESVSEGVIARWVKRDGDAVAVDDVLLELETDKATMEIPSTAAGRLQIVAPEGSTVAVGAVVARIAEGEGAARADGGAPAGTARGAADAKASSGTGRGEGSSSAPAAAAAAGTSEATPGAAAKDSERPAAHPPAEPAHAGDGDRSGPAVRRLLAEHRLDPAEIAGTGKGGRITKEDVVNRVGDAKAAPEAPPAAPAKAPAAPRPAPATRPAATARDESDRREPMSRLRQRIAERLVEAQRTAAILTTFNEIDCSAIMDARRRHRERFKQTHGVDLGLMSLFSRAAIMALGDVPVVNARIEGTDVVHPAHVHLGIAVSTERGLVVPVVRRADAMGLADLERAIGEVAARAREGRLVPDDLAGGTFSITNGGVFGSLLSTPILNPPQSGILGMHKIEERPIAVSGQVVIRPMMYVALSYDHRLVDGQQAVTFLVRIKERLEDPVRMLLAV